MAATSNSGRQPPSISEVVENVGFGPAQLLAGFLGGGVYLCGGATLLMAGSLSDSIGQTFHLKAWERATIMSAMFVGMFLGNSSSGPLGDSFGRRGVILVSLIFSFVTGLACVFSLGFPSLCFWRLMLGIAFGLGVPPWMVLCTEITPAAWRIPSNAYSQSLFVVGEVYSALIIMWTDSSMKHLEWRSLTVTALLPGLVLAVLAWLFLVQSPAYLATKGEHEAARQVLVKMARQNGAAPVPSTLRQEAVLADGAGCFEVQYQALFGRRMWFSTLTVIYSCFVLNLVFYGVLYGLPQVVEGVDTGTTPATSVLLGAIWEFPGLAAGALFGVWFRRLPVICGCYVGMSCALGCFGLGLSIRHVWYSHYMIQGAILMVKMLSNTAFVVIYQYASEIYPAFARTTGSAICVSGGRLGAILAPAVFETLADYTGRFSAFFWVACVCAALNAFLVLFLPIETAGRSLDDEMEPALAKGKTIASLKLAIP